LRGKLGRGIIELFIIGPVWAAAETVREESGELVVTLTLLPLTFRSF
jgi:hypothetical protein